MKFSGDLIKEAHEMTKKFKAEYTDVDYKVQFGLCLSYLLLEKKGDAGMQEIFSTLKMSILAENLQYVQDKIQQFNKKAVKLNKKEITLNYTSSYIDSTDVKDIKEVVDIEVVRQENVVIAGYKIIAKIDHTYPSKNFVVTYDNATKEQQQKWQHIDSNCEHCNTRRKRNITYILQNVETNKYIQVGKSCLKDFLGYNIHATLMYYNLLEELNTQLHNIPATKKTNTHFYKTLDILNLISNEIEENGYYSSKECWRTEEKTTATRVKEKLSTNKFTAIDDNKQQELSEVVNYMISYDINKEKNEDQQEFYKKLQNVLKHEYCKYTDISLLAPVFVIVDILKDKEKEELAKTKSKYMYNVKDKIEIKLTQKDMFGYNTKYGYMHIYIFKDVEGNTYKWNSSNALEMEYEKWYTVKATVKAHEEYKGEKQTVLTRCKIVK